VLRTRIAAARPGNWTERALERQAELGRDGAEALSGDLAVDRSELSIERGLHFSPQRRRLARGQSPLECDGESLSVKCYRLPA
jgi:hypothetical protein